MGRASRRPLPAPAVLRVDDVDAEGRGIARLDGKVVFIEGALVGETVRARFVRVRGRFDEAVVDAVVTASPHRVVPRCPYFERCGGCSQQHLSHTVQVEVKQRALLGALRSIAHLAPTRVLPPIVGDPWLYRRKARLGVKYVPAKGGALVGFRERGGGRIAEIERCEILAEPMASLIRPLRELVNGLAARSRIPQVEIAVADNATALVFRNLDPLSEADEAALCAFAERHGVQAFQQPGGPDSVAALFPRSPSPLHYRLPGGNGELCFEASDFVQVNSAVNESLVQQAVYLLALDGSESVLDLFCGLGNFTLPIARHARRVHGVEGSESLVRRARENAGRNGSSNASFDTADLFASESVARALHGGWDRLLLDPPRAGAIEVVEGLHAPFPSRLVYVSCNPATLARDAAILVSRHGYRLVAAGVADMFPHTSHVESMALFEHG